MQPEIESPPVKDFPVPLSGSQLPSTEVREVISDYDDSADLRDYLEVMLRHKWLILTVLLGVFVTTLVVSLSMKPVFKAGGRLQLNVQGPRVTKFEDVVANQMQTREFIQTQVKLLQSESLARRVIAHLNLDRNPVFNPAVEKDGEEEGWFQTWKRSVKAWLPFKGDEELNPELARLQVESAVERLFADSLQVTPERDTTLISLEFQSTDAALARDIVNAQIQEFISWQMDKRIDGASSAKQQLEKQLEVARINLEKAENNLNSFAQKAGIVSLDSNLNLIYRQLEETNKALAVAETERINKEALFNHAQRDNIASMPVVLENKLIQNLKEEHVKLVGEYQELSTVFKDDYPRLKNLKAKMNDIESRLSREEQRMLDSIKNEYATLVKREDALRKDAEKKKDLALELNNRATQYKVLEREVETSKLIHQSLLERGKEIDANVGIELGNVQVVDYATLPLRPFKPNVRLNLLLAIVVGLMGGIGIAFFMEYLDNTVKRVEEISERFRIPVLGVLPVADSEELKDLDSLVRLKPRASFSEAIRTAKVGIQLSAAMDDPPKSLLITSTSASQGKSTISSNISQAFAASEEKVVIIDADLRKPRLHRIFSHNGNGNGRANGNGNGNGISSGLNKRKGLSQLLSGMCKLEEVIQKTDIPNLFFISAGPIPPNPAELLASNRMKMVMEMLSKHFDRVIVDAPPAAGFADVLVLGNYVNGVILVSTLGETHREALRIFRRSLLNVRGNLLGCIVNKLNRSHHFGGYYSKYYKYYNYYHTAYGTSPDAIPEETAVVQ